jgi:hypothetical protein
MHVASRPDSPLPHQGDENRSPHPDDSEADSPPASRPEADNAPADRPDHTSNPESNDSAASSREGHSAEGNDVPRHVELLSRELADMRPWDRERVDRAITPGRLFHDLIESGCPEAIAASAIRSPYAGMTAHELLENFWDADKHTWKWPPHDGFKDGVWSVTDRIPMDIRLDRIGLVTERTGDFMGVEGDSYPSRGLAPGTSGDYNVFRGTGATLPPGWEVRYGEVADVFDQPGGGTQWVVVDEYGKTVLIDTLIEEELIVPVSGPYYENWMRNREAANGH